MCRERERERAAAAAARRRTTGLWSAADDWAKNSELIARQSTSTLYSKRDLSTYTLTSKQKKTEGQERRGSVRAKRKRKKDGERKRNG